MLINLNQIHLFVIKGKGGRIYGSPSFSFQPGVAAFAAGLEVWGDTTE